MEKRKYIFTQGRKIVSLFIYFIPPVEVGTHPMLVQLFGRKGHSCGKKVSDFHCQRSLYLM